MPPCPSLSLSPTSVMLEKKGESHSEQMGRREPVVAIAMKVSAAEKQINESRGTEVKC
ncbi:unnamed protein product [Menidia menidia]|uniref:(Atlantic silverside) hypothetical protein n=1 Tax=Menidia menidia TaxID=238744 RepID=A0A8S4BK65_9TELE|nr:unnamed protein product [Menidia menidia]